MSTEAEARLHQLAHTMPSTYAAALREALELLGEARTELAETRRQLETTREERNRAHVEEVAP